MQENEWWRFPVRVGIYICNVDGLGGKRALVLGRAVESGAVKMSQPAATVAAVIVPLPTPGKSENSYRCILQH